MIAELQHRARYNQMIEDDGQDYVFAKRAEERAAELIDQYWMEYIFTGRVDTFDWDETELEHMAHKTFVSDIKTVMQTALEDKIIEALNDRTLPNDYRTLLLGPGDNWD